MSRRDGLAEDATHVVRGLLMGAADVVPGVSGGTVALIVGIYERLVTAISHVDWELFRLVGRGRFAEAAAHLDLRFLVALVAGIGIGIVGLGGLVNRLLVAPGTRGATLALFLGLILASCVLVARMIPKGTRRERVTAVVLAVAGIAFAWWITGLPTSSAEPGLLYVFVCGMVAICAMILPGISGAYLLLVLGLYLSLTDILKRLPHGDVTGADLVTVTVFGCGALIGIVGFSKILRVLLARLPGPTLAVLTGFMIGALRRVWPFQADITPEVHDASHKTWVNVWPDRLDGEVLVAVAVSAVGLALVFGVDRIVRGKAVPPARH